MTNTAVHTRVAFLEPKHNHRRNGTSSVVTTKEYARMLIHEELARERIRDMLRSASEQRQGRRFRGARRWERLAGWAQRRADQYRL